MHSHKAPKRQRAIDSMPNEVLSAIFIFTKPDDPQLLHDAFPDDLLRVCRHWRNVAQHTPRLWTSFKVELPRVLSRVQGYNIRLKRKLERLPSVMLDWLNQSHPLPITVRLEADKQFTWDQNGGSVATLVQTLCGASHRWKDIDVVFPVPYARRIVQAAHACTESCTRLVVSVTNHSMEQSPIPIPNIAEVDVLGIPMSLEGIVNLPAIRYLDLNSVDGPDFCIQLIACAPNLEELCLTFTREKLEYSGDPVVAEKLTLMNLTFDVQEKSDDEEDEVDEDENPFNIFQKVTAPCLTALFLYEPRSTFSHVESLMEFLTLSKCEHKLLQFCYHNRSSWSNPIGTIHDICRLTTSLLKLDVRILAAFSQFAEFFTPLQSKEHLPLLTDLTFGVDDWPHNDGYVQILRDFAQARCLDNGGQLEYVSIIARYNKFRFEVEEGEFLEEFSDIGVKFRVQLKPWLGLARRTGASVGHGGQM